MAELDVSGALDARSLLDGLAEGVVVALADGTIGYVNERTAQLLGTTLALLGLGLVQAATACALVELDAGRPVGPIHAYRTAFAKTGPRTNRSTRPPVVLSSSITSVPVMSLGMRSGVN